MSSIEKLPVAQAEALRRARRLEVVSLSFTALTVPVVALVLGNSQAMKTAWIEDILSTVPQLSFLIALAIVARTRTRRWPYGYHRASGLGHLVSSVTLGVVALFLLYESLAGLITVERPTIGTVELLGRTVWLGWLMMAVMAAISWPPVLLGYAKMKLAPVLHDKLLFADARMNKADWMTSLASIVGVAGIGIGLWWMDYAAALLISLEILKDATKNTRSALSDLMDRRATTYDLEAPHPLLATMQDLLVDLPWVEDAEVRMRDLGRVFHAEIFVVPRSPDVSLTQLTEAARACRDLDWKMRDVSIVPVAQLPVFAEPSRSAGADDPEEPAGTV